MKITHCKLNWCLAGKQNNRGTERKNRKKKKKKQTNKQTNWQTHRWQNPLRSRGHVRHFPFSILIPPRTFSQVHKQNTTSPTLTAPDPSPPHTPPSLTSHFHQSNSPSLSQCLWSQPRGSDLNFFYKYTQRLRSLRFEDSVWLVLSLSLSNLTTVFYFFGPKKSLTTTTTTTTTANIFLGFYRFF